MNVVPNLTRAHAFSRFWRGTGFSPGELLLTPEMQRTLKLVAATPRHGVQYLRPHFLLNLVRTRGAGYDFSLLEEACDVMVENGFTPFFEIMGNPSDSFDFSSDGWAPRWRDLVAELVQRLGTRYGHATLRDWYFESWNEPDLPWWPAGEQAFLDYYDACVAGLDAGLPGLRIGGPGTARTLSPMFEAFVAHCDSGLNHLSGERPRLDFISIHEKGVGKSFEDIAPDSVGICRRERQAVGYLRAHHPRLADLPLINNECDPQVGWWQHHTWRATAYAPAMITKIIDQHQRLMIDTGTSLTMLFNDNGFMGEWGQRTQFALFGGRDVSKAQSEHVTDLNRVEQGREAAPFSLVKKPALTVMELLAQLGETRVPVDGLTPDTEGPGILATRHNDGSWAVMLYHSRDATRLSGSTTVSLILPETEGEWDLLVLALDDVDDNPFTVWERGGHARPPVVPKLAAPDQALADMRRAAEPREHAAQRFVDGVSLDIDVPLPSVALVLARPASDEAPDAPQPSLARVPGLNDEEWLVSWPDSNEVGLRYDVGLERDGAITSIVDSPILANAYVLSREADSSISVRSVSMSGRTSRWASARS